MERIVVRRGGQRGGRAASYFRKIVVREEGGPEFMKNLEPPDIHSHAKLVGECFQNGQGHTPKLLGATQHTLGEGLLLLLSVAAPADCMSLTHLAVHSGTFPPIRWQVSSSRKGNKPLSLAVVPGCECIGAWVNSDWCYPANIDRERKDLVVPLFAKLAAIYIYYIEEKQIIDSTAALLGGTNMSAGTMIGPSGGGSGKAPSVANSGAGTAISAMTSSGKRWKFSGAGYGGCVANCCVMLMPSQAVDSLVTFGAPPTFSHPEGLMPFPHSHLQHCHDIVPHCLTGKTAPAALARLEGLGFIFPLPPFERLLQFKPTAKRFTLYDHPTNHVYVLYPNMGSYGANMTFYQDAAGNNVMPAATNAPRNHQRETTPQLEMEGRTSLFDVRHMHPFVAFREYLVAMRILCNKKSEIPLSTRMPMGMEILCKFIGPTGEFLHGVKGVSDLLLLQQGMIAKSGELQKLRSESIAEMSAAAPGNAPPPALTEKAKSTVTEQKSLSKVKSGAASKDQGGGEDSSKGQQTKPRPRAVFDIAEVTSVDGDGGSSSPMGRKLSDVEVGEGSVRRGSLLSEGGSDGGERSGKESKVNPFDRFKGMGQKIAAGIGALGKMQKRVVQLSPIEFALLKAPKLVAILNERRASGDTDITLPAPDTPFPALNVLNLMQQMGDSAENLSSFFKQFSAVSCWDARHLAKQLMDWGGFPPLFCATALTFVEANRMLFASATAPRKAPLPRHLSTPMAVGGLPEDVRQLLSDPDGFHLSWSVAVLSVVHGVGKSKIIAGLRTEGLQSTAMRDQPYLKQSQSDKPPLAPASPPRRSTISPALGATRSPQANSLESSVLGRGGPPTLMEDFVAEPMMKVKWAPIITERLLNLPGEGAYGTRRTVVVGAQGGPDSLLLKVKLQECFWNPKGVLLSTLNNLNCCAASLWVVCDHYSFDQLTIHVDFRFKRFGGHIPDGTWAAIIYSYRKGQTPDVELESRIAAFCIEKDLKCASVEATDMYSTSNLQRLLIQWMIPSLNLPIEPALLPPGVDIGALFTNNESAVMEFISRVCALGIPTMGPGQGQGYPEFAENDPTAAAEGPQEPMPDQDEINPGDMSPDEGEPTPVPA